MNDLEAIRQSGLYRHLEQQQELLVPLMAMRSIVEHLAETVAREVPSFTDHSIRHMDALWVVADQVLTPAEINALTFGEAFLLGSGFYLHDIGMAYAATAEGLKKCQDSPSFKATLAVLPETERNSEAVARATALAVRAMHARAAEELATHPVPGTGQYLFEAQAVRDAWGETCGKIAASHHWDLERVERELGRRGTVPLPNGQRGDLAYIATVLRIVDYAHINRDRAPAIDRGFRKIDESSVVHWLAQENIDGPVRESDDLVYHAARPVQSVDAWWLYFSMISGLDAEIRAVRRYLGRSATRKDRFSLQGVRGAAAPEDATTYIEPAGFLPIEISLRTGSIDRLVHLLAGESLYGPDPTAAVRELIQNARDAVALKATTDLSESDKAIMDLPIQVSIRRVGSDVFLEVTDHGVGMTKKVMTEYLIAIASDYWGSQFHSDFPKAIERGFQPAGRFGIGFLSVFMLGTEVTV
ncbi:MAG: ATP-binding protein [Planctomycetes bacterium]|nr:ATP-binding protein [Planctomycetota bacterium]